MMPRSIVCLLASFWLLAAPATAQKKIALTFNDLPARGPFGYWTHREISNIILRTLNRHEIQAAGFVVQEKIDDAPMTYVVLDDWASRGHLLGNETYSRVDYNELGYDDLLEHMRDGQKDIRRLGRQYKFNYRYLRFPQLHQGNTERKRNKIRKFFEGSTYQIAHVSVKTSDHRFIRAYLEYGQNAGVLERVKAFFLGHVSENLDYAESQSQKVFGRNIHHILLLRCNIATASFLNDVILLLKERGYEFISLPDALADTAYRTEEEYVGPLGLSFIDRVASDRGIPFDGRQGDLREGDVERWLDSGSGQR